MRKAALVAAILTAAPALRAAEWKSLEVVNDRTICLTFDDLVSVDYGKIGGGMADQRVVTAPMDLTRADDVATYAIEGDGITAVGRKTVPHAFVRFNKYSTQNAFQHSIYLSLAEPLKPGATLKVSVPVDLVTGGPSTMSLTFDPARSRSEAIHVNQFGYLPGAVKFAQLSYWAGSMGGLPFVDGTPFHILDKATRRSIFDGAIHLRVPASVSESGCGEGNYAHADQFEADFSAIRTPGSYVLSIDGVGCSYPFDINDAVFTTPFVTTMRGMLHQRCGIELKEPFTAWDHPACHLGPKLQTDHRYMDRPFSDGGNPKNFKLTGETRTDVWGGWHDAADWDREGNHSDIPARLLIAFQLTPDHYFDGQLNLPERGDGIPDIVNEAMWGIDFGKRMQTKDGGVSVGFFESGVPKDGEVAWTDSLTQYVYANEPVATYKYAANAAHLVPILRQLHKTQQANEYLASAKLAFDWAGQNMRPGDEPKVLDGRCHAEAALFLATGEKNYQDKCIEDCVVKTGWENLAAWPKLDQTMAAWTIALAPDDTPNLDKAFRERVRAAVLRHADANITSSAKRGNRNSFNYWFNLNWGRGSQTDDIALMVAHKLSGNAKYYDAIVNDCNATLGSNPLNMTWITGLGDRSPHEVMQMNYWWHPRGINPGIATPGPFAYNKWAGTGVWQIGYTWKFIYPRPEQWPPLELWFENRLCPPTNEGVVETESKTAVSLGYLIPAR